MTTLTGTNKAAMVNPIVAPTETLRAATDDQMALAVATKRAATVVRMTTPTVATNKVAMADRKNRTKTPRVGTDDRMTTRMAANKVAMVDPTTNPTKIPREVMDSPTTPTGTTAAVMVDRTKIDRKIPTEAAPLVTADRMITPMEAIRAMADLTTSTTPVPMADRRSAAVVRGCYRAVRNVC